MSLTDVLAGGAKLPRKHTCKIVTIHEALPVDQQEALDIMMSDPAWASTVIARELTRMGHPISNASLQRHRKRDCLCEPH